MHLKQSPFDTQELVHSIIWHIDHTSAQSKRDLLTCALVARLWTYPAQSCIFRQLHWDPNDICLRWPLLRCTLDSAPYLVQHIRRLRIFWESIDFLDFKLFLDMCTFPFTHLEHADVSLEHAMPVQDILAVRQLFGLTTLRSVGFCWMGRSYDPELFGRLWELCSPSIKHLALSLHGDCHPPPKSAPRRSQTPVIFLESLHIDNDKSLKHALDATPFSLEQLNKLSVASNPEPILWHSIIPSLKNVQYFAFNVEYGKRTASIDLSLLPNLVVLGILWFNCDNDAAEPNLKVLSSINAAHQISTIIIHDGVFVSSACEELDAKLSSLPMRQPPIVVLDMDIATSSQWRQHMPRLRSSNRLRRVVKDPECRCCR
ncbi:hypothetical protein GGX14DRAFT_417179, partial [Mycena pura]